MADTGDNWIPPTLEPTVTDRELPGVQLIGRRCVVALVALALLTCTEAYVLSSQARLLKSETLVANASGQQSYRWSRFNLGMVHLVNSPLELRTQHKMLRDTLDEFAATHERLLHGNPQAGFPEPPASVKFIMNQPPYELDRRAREYVAAIRAIIDVPPDQLTNKHPVMAEFGAKALDPQLLNGIEALVIAWTAENEHRLAALQTTGNACLAASFTVLILMWLTVFAPMIRRVRSEALELLSVNQALNRQTWQLHTEIKERIDVEAALRISRERFQVAMELALDAVITIDDQGRVTAWNAQAERTFGWTGDEVLGQPMHELILPERFREAHVNGLHRFMVTGESEILGRRRELVGLRRNGEEFPVELSLAPLRLEGGFEFSGFLRDITVRKQIESALQRLNENLELMVAERSGYVQLLKDVAVLANEAESVELALRAALDMIARFMNWPVGAAYIPDEDEPSTFVPCVFWAVDQSEEFHLLREVTFHTRMDAKSDTIGRVVATGRPVWIADLGRDDAFENVERFLQLGLQTTLAFPIVVGREVVAVLEFFARAGVTPDDALLDILAHLGTQLGRVVERRRLQAQLIDAVWEQQRELGQELHDTVGQELTGLAMMSSSLERKLDDRPTERERAAELTHYIRQSQSRVRALSKGLFPVDVDAEGLRTALAEFTAAVSHRHEILCLFDGDDNVRVYDNKVATHLFRITQEAVHNAVKHARPEHIVVRLRADPLGLAMYVYDDGRGMVPSNCSPGMGLRIMRYRAAAIGATLTITPNDDGGTLMSCILPRKD